MNKNEITNEKKIVFLVGPHGGGKTTYIYKKMIDATTDKDGNIDLNKKAYLVVPEQDTKEKQKGFMDYKGNKSNGMINCDVVSFDRICHMVFSKLMLSDVDNMDIIQDDMKALFCQIAVEKRSSDLPLYKRKARKIGFSQKLASAISEFATYQINQDKINKIINDNRVEKSIKDELMELCIIQDEFNILLESTKLNIVENKLKLLSDNIDRVDIFDNSTIFFDGFTGFSPIQREVFEKIKNKAKQVYVAIDYREKEFSDYLLNKYDNLSNNEKYESNIFHISDIFMESICDKETIKDSYILVNDGLDNKYKDSKDLLYIEENIFNDQIINNYDGSISRVHIIENKDISEELEVVINKIIELTRISDNPITYNDIKIIVPNLETYKDSIISKFEKYRLPLFIDESQSIFYSPYVKAIRAFIDLCEKDFSYESLMGYINSGIFDKDGILHIDKDLSTISDRSLYYFDNALRMFGVDSYRALSPKRAFYRNIYRYIMKNEKLKSGSEREYLSDSAYTDLLLNIDMVDKSKQKEISTKTKKVSNSIKNVVEEHAGEIYKVYNDILIPIISLYEKYILKNKNKQFTLCEFVLFVKDFIKEIKLDSNFENYINVVSRAETFETHSIELDLINNKDLVMLKGSVDKINKILDLLDKIGKTNIVDDKHIKYSLQELSLILDSAIDIYKVKSIPFSMDQIVVGDLMRSRFDNPKVLFFLGMNDSALPQKRNDDNIINDKMREVFASNSIQLSQSLVETTYNSRFYTYQALSNPYEHLYLSYTKLSSEEQSDYKSKFLMDVEELFDNINIEIKTNKDDLSIYDKNQMKDYISLHNADNTLVMNKIDTYIDDYDNLNKYKKVMTKNALLSKYYYDLLKEIENNKELLDKENRAYKNISIRHTKINKNVINKLYPDGFKTSATAMEKYASCPYKYFLENMIGISERDNNEIDARNIGNIFHYTIEKFFENGKHFTNIIDNEGNEIVNKEVLTDIELKNEIYTICDNAIRYEFENSAKENDTNSQQFLAERLKETVYISIKYMLNQLKTESPLVRIYHELPFDDYVVGESNDSSLVGRIDQVELLRPFKDINKYKLDDEKSNESLTNDNILYIKIIDYKSSNKKISKDKIEKGQMMQFVIYLDYIREALNKKVFADNIKKYFAKDDKILEEYNRVELLGTFYKSILDNIVSIKKDDYDNYKKGLEKQDGQLQDDIATFKMFVSKMRNDNMKMSGLINISDNKMKVLDYNAKAARKGSNIDNSNTNINSFNPDGYLSLRYDNEFEELIHNVKSLIDRQINDIKEGRLPVVAQNNLCKYCLLSGSCGIERLYIEEDDNNA